MFSKYVTDTPSMKDKILNNSGSVLLKLLGDVN